jgi:Reverse transcriptase (RNA-dependent DNA polymerase)
MANELTALAKNSTWDLIIPPSDAHIIGCKWAFKLKRRSNGTIERYKARLVAKSYTQEEDIDYTNTSSLVIKTTTNRVVLTLVFSQSWQLQQLDMDNAFLHDELSETIFMQQSLCFVDPLKPQQTLYGLK